LAELLAPHAIRRNDAEMAAKKQPRGKSTALRPPDPGPDYGVERVVQALRSARRADPKSREAVEAQIRFAARIGRLPYVTAGFPLAREVFRAFEQRPDVTGIIVARHGLFTFGDDARTAYERHIEIVDACERWLSARRPQRLLTPRYRANPPAAELAARAAPVLRGLLAEPTNDEDAPYRRWLLDWRADDDVLAERVLLHHVQVGRHLHDVRELFDARLLQLVAAVGLHRDRHVLHVFRALLRRDDDFLEPGLIGAGLLRRRRRCVDQRQCRQGQQWNPDPVPGPFKGA
jgi:hypothetical protein